MPASAPTPLGKLRDQENKLKGQLKSVSTKETEIKKKIKEIHQKRKEIK